MVLTRGSGFLRALIFLLGLTGIPAYSEEPPPVINFGPSLGYDFAAGGFDFGGEVAFWFPTLLREPFAFGLDFGVTNHRLYAEVQLAVATLPPAGIPWLGLSLGPARNFEEKTGELVATGWLGFWLAAPFVRAAISNEELRWSCGLLLKASPLLWADWSN